MRTHSEKQSMKLSAKIWNVLALFAVLVAAAALLWKGKSAGPLKFVEYSVGEGKETPIAIAAGKDGSAWFTLDSLPALGVVRQGKLERFKLPTASVEPLGIGVDPQGQVWTTDASGGAIRRLNAQGEVSTVALNTPIARLGRLAVGKDGAIWFAESTAYSFTRLKDGVLTRNVFNSVGGGPYGIALAPSGSAWGTLQSGNQIVEIAADGKVSEFDIPTPGSAPTDVTVDANGAVWFVEFRANKIGRYSQGKFEEYALPEGAAAPSGIAAAADGSVWFGVLRGAALGRVRNGIVSIHPLPRPTARPYSLAADAAGNIWYADLSGFIGMLPAGQNPK